jgi:hypothetical protein
MLNQLVDLLQSVCLLYLAVAILRTTRQVREFVK